MAKTKPFPEEITKKLESPAPMVRIGMIDGIDVEATIDDEKLVFHHRLNAF